MTTVRISVPEELLDRAYALGIDIPAVMRTALEERVAATRMIEVTTMISDDSEDAGPLGMIAVHPTLGYPL